MIWQRVGAAAKLRLNDYLAEMVDLLKYIPDEVELSCGAITHRTVVATTAPCTRERP